MAWKRRVTGGILAAAGFMLSPLSWWNDAFVNLPLALAFAWLVSAFYRPAFEVAVVVGYWLTNLLGFVLLHTGTRRALNRESRISPRRELLRDIGISVVYTVLIVALIKFGVLKPFQAYFPGAAR